MSAARDARNKLGWRYRRGVPTLLFLPVLALILVLGHHFSSLSRYVFELHVESRREMKVLSGRDLEDARSTLRTPIEEPAPDCWLELSKGRLARSNKGQVEVVHVDDVGVSSSIAVDPNAGEELASTVSPFCWRQTTDNHFVAAIDDGQTVLLLKEYYNGAWTRDFQAFASIFLLFALAAVGVAAVLRRPAGAELVLASLLAAGLEIALLVHSVGGDTSVFAHPLFIRDALGNEYAGLLGFAPLVFVFFVALASAGIASLTGAMIDEVREQRRCSACLGPSPLSLPRRAPCPLCGTEHAPERVQWLVVSACALGVGLLLATLLHFGKALSMYEVCTWAHPSESCKEAMQGGDGVLDWLYYGKRGLFDGDPGSLVTFRPVIYASIVAAIFVVLPFVLARYLRDGYRTTMAVLGILWLTSFVVSATIVAGGQPYFYIVLIRWHLVCLILFGIIGLISATTGIRLRGSTAEGLVADLTDDEAPPSDVSEDAQTKAKAAETPFRGAQPDDGKSPQADEPLPEDMVAALRTPFVVRQKWKILGVLAVAGLVAGGIAFFRFRAPPEDRFTTTPFGKALGDPLVRFTSDMAGDRGKEARALLLSDDVKGQVGADTVDDLRAVLDAAAAFEKSPSTDEDARKPLFASVDALDDKLSSHAIPAHLRAYTSGSRVWLMSYAVRARNDVKFGAGSLRAIRGARIDDGNMGDERGFRPTNTTSWVLVSMDALEVEFLGRALQAITHGVFAKPREIGDHDPSGKAALLRHVGELVGAEMVAGSKLSKDDAADIDAKLAQRNEWIDELASTGVILDKEHLAFPRGVALSLARGKDARLEQITKLDDQLRSYKRDVTTAVDLLADLLEQEFVVRIIEEERLKDTSIERLKQDRIDEPEFRAVVSSELGKLARHQTCPRLALWRTIERMFADGYSGWGHATGRLIVGALMKELAIPTPDTLVGKDLSDAELLAAVRALVDKSPDEVASAAARAYPSIFNAPPPPFTRAAVGAR